mgnify:CR=1 FL=1
MPFNETFTPFKPPERAVAQDWPSLGEHLKSAGMVLDAADPPRQFDSGFGNLNYRIVVDGSPVVLRRPPMGPVNPGSNDMLREGRILSRLWREFPLAPRCLHVCEQPDVLGAPFILMQYRPGRVIGGSFPSDLADRLNAGAFIGERLVATLAELHAIDPAAVDLDTLGRPEGFLERTTNGWAKRARLSWDTEPPPVLDRVLDWLGANQPSENPAAATLLHNDFKLDNVILDPDTLDPIAVIDWDMGTRGDPLHDLAVLLSYWTEADDPPVMHELNQMPSAGFGFPTRRQIAEAYSAESGRDLDGLRFFRVLAVLRLAVIFMQLNRRFRESGGDPRFASFGELANGLLSFADDVSANRYF